ncbi:MAG: ribonuclease Z [Bacteroidetes bacterium]|nr:ribonuclease Z [Bacteroidota bacterium]MBS1739497.1 ribonuclease Z [Bacteroidota bacterium]
MTITILGNNSALPAYERHPTAQIVSIGSEVLLIDCGEGTQMQMQLYGHKWRKLNHIFISHLHGDHYFGLPGLINSMSLLGRTQPLNLYAPIALQAILDQMMLAADSQLNYSLHFHPLTTGEASLLVENKSFSVKSFPVEHRIDCHGFLVEEKTHGMKLLPEKCREYQIPAYFYHRIKNGEDYQRNDGFMIKSEWVTAPALPGKKYAYCADTRYTESFLPHILQTDLLYHESTYLDEEAEKAAQRFHSTSKQAAKIAKVAGAKKLLLGHFSSKYKDLQPFQDEASEIFPNVLVSKEGESYEI